MTKLACPCCACPCCGVLGACWKCQSVVMSEEIARATTSDLIDALITSAIENHEDSSWHSIPSDKLVAIRVELNARLPPRS